MSFEACAALVEKADPLRFRVAMAAPVPARRILFPLYAFNVEVARAPWVTQEAMIAEMRLQWWRDALEEIGQGGNVRRHEVVDGLAQILDAEGAACLDGLVAARRWDIYKDAFEDAAHFDDYIDATSGHLMWTGARLLGAADEGVVRDHAYGVGVANLFQAIPALEAQGRKPLRDFRRWKLQKVSQPRICNEMICAALMRRKLQAVWLLFLTCVTPWLIFSAPLPAAPAVRCLMVAILAL